MKRALLIGAVLALVLSACGDQDEPDRDDVPAEDGSGDDERDRDDRDDHDDRDDDERDEDGGAATQGDVQVLNFHGDEAGFDEQRPTEYVATEFTTFTDMEWDEWDEGRARGEGEVLGTWCMDQGCQDDPYDVDVELGDPVDVDGTMYFSTYTITDYDDDMPEETREAFDQADDGKLGVPR